MKKLISLCLIFVLVLSFTACDSFSSELDSTVTLPSDMPPAATLAGEIKPITMPVEDIYTRLGELINLPAMIRLDSGMMLDYCGIQPAKVKQAYVAICEDSLRTDEIWMLEATDAAAAQELIKLAETRLSRKGEESKTYSPEQYAVVEKAVILQNGNHVILLVSPGSATMTEFIKTITGTAFNQIR